MTEEEFRKVTIEIEKERLNIEKEKLALEKRLVRKNIGSLVSSFAAILVAIMGIIGVNSYQDALAKELAERKLDVYLTYSSTVNQAWAQYAVSQNVNSQLRQQGIDAFEELRLIGSEQLVNTASKVNGHFAALYAPYVVTHAKTQQFNTDLLEFQKMAREDFENLRSQ